MIERVTHRDVSEEPIGIVIARGRVDDTPPRFAAFEWAPAPDVETETSANKAA